MKEHPRSIRGGAILTNGNGINRPAASGRFLVLLVVIDFGEFRIDNVVLFAVAAASTSVAVTAGLLLGGLLIHCLAELHGNLRKRIGLGRDGVGVAAFQGFLEVGHGVLDRTAVGFADFRTMLGERFLGRVDKRLGVVFRLDLRFALLVLLGVGLGILDHLLDIGLGQAAGRLNADLLLLTGAFVFRGNVDDSVGVDVESDLDLRHAARRR